MLAFGVQTLLDAPAQALRVRCQDWKMSWPPKDALAACDRLLADHPDAESNALAWRGSAYYRLEDYRRAGADYAAAIRFDPRDSSSHYNLGLVHEQLGDRELAVVDYGAAIELDQKNVDAFQNRGLIYLDTGQFNQAISDFTQVYELAPTNVTNLANRGVAYAWKNDRIRAEQDFAAVRKSDPKNLVLLHGEALLALNRGDMEEGVRLLSESIALNPKDAWALSMRAKAYRILGNGEKTRENTIAA